MTKKELIDKYPHLFECGRSRYFEVPNGWMSLVEEMIQNLENQPFFSELSLAQAKEKFGVLRVYFDNLPEREEDRRALEHFKREAETKSASTCLSCGSSGFLHTRDGWFLTLCTLCGLKYGALISHDIW